MKSHQAAVRIYDFFREHTEMETFIFRIVLGSEVQ